MDTAVQTAVGAVCADNGAMLIHAIAWLGGTVGLASIVANFRNKLPAPVVKVVDIFALNFVKALVQAVSDKDQGQKP